MHSHLDNTDNRELSIILPRGRRSLTCLYCSDEGPPVMVLPGRVKVRPLYCQGNPMAVIASPWQTNLTPLAPPKRPAEEKETERAEAQ